MNCNRLLPHLNCLYYLNEVFKFAPQANISLRNNLLKLKLPFRNTNTIIIIHKHYYYYCYYYYHYFIVIIISFATIINIIITIFFLSTHYYISTVFAEGPQ